METQVKRWQQKVSTKQTNSAWVTKAWLMADRHWTKSMCDRAFEWAKRQGLWQVNPIHGEEEASLVIERLFSTEEQEGEAFSQSGSFATEDTNGSFLTKEVNVDEASKVTSSSEVFGDGGSSFKMADKIGLQVTDLSAKFDALSDLQGQALTGSLEEKQEDIKAIFAEITKKDVALNNTLVRARYHDPAPSWLLAVPFILKCCALLSTEHGREQLRLGGSLVHLLNFTSGMVKWFHRGSKVLLLHLHKETCKLSEFSLKTFKIQSHPGGIQTCAVDIELDSSAHIAPRSLIEVEDDEHLWACMKYTACACSAWFRGLYANGLFLSAHVAKKLIPYGWALTEGYGFLASMCAERGYCLYRVKPKLHMQEHFPNLILSLEL
ncbi:unnamed protein product [Durusdinium trenchii]|uniref:Uncharacterized protein n=1 Tax=Durusdinium trenchii TaxID=1381693 RepID=A0ABP0KX70_9DINO